MPLQVRDASDTPQALTASEWAALQAAHLLGFINVEQRRDELLLRFSHKPDAGDDRAASLLEAFGVPRGSPMPLAFEETLSAAG